MKMNVWHDDGDDGVTGWQPIGEPLIRTKERTANSDAQPETNKPRARRNPGRNEERMSTQKRNNKYDGMNKGEIIARILEDVKPFFGPQDERFAKAMYEELVANGTIKEK